MSMRTISEQEAIGKTVSAVHEYGDNALLVFTDKTALLVESIPEDESSAEVRIGSIAGLGRLLGAFGADQLIRWGIASAEDVAAARAKEREEAAALREVTERAEFERLSKKFGTPEAK